MASWRTNEQHLLRDALTGLPSRLLVMSRLQSALGRLERTGGHVAVMFIDLDRFKVVNDSLGHDAGDRLLVAVAGRLRAALRRHEVPARFGGDEFVLVCEDVEDPRDAAAVAERLLRVLARPFELAEGQAFIAGSIGIAVTDDPQASPSDLVRDADAAMYHAKEAGGGRWSIFEQVIRDRAVARQATEAALRTAIAQDELVVHFQPEVAVSTGEIVGVEALVRWERPGAGLVPPAEFIPIAEETGLIVPIGAWVLREAGAEAMRLFDDGSMVVRVNVSARQLAEPGLTATVTDALAASGLPPEPVPRGHGERRARGRRPQRRRAAGAARPRRRRLARRLRHRLLLAELPAPPADRQPEDRPLVRARPRSRGRRRLDRHVGHRARPLARRVGRRRGVETEQQLAALRERGCDTMQGHLFSPPVPSAAIGALIREPAPSAAA